ncbi:MAG: hypothetical protein E3K37_15105 [Candidatus Kuenenia sp.]|nr:hypothetical protein [Candidatus Kuenenia hertensis]
MKFTLEKNFKASDLLTSLTIIVSVIALIITWTKDRDLRVREQADRIRTAGAETLAKLERWQALQLSLYDQLQPVLVETSEMLDREFNIIVARDYLWKQINAEHTQISSKVLEEGFETAYVDLFAYYPSIRQKFLDVVDSLKASEQNSVESLLLNTQDAITSFQGKRSTYSTAQLGNALRAALAHTRNKFVQDTNSSLMLIRDQLYTLISTPDKDLIHNKAVALK